MGNRACPRRSPHSTFNMLLGILCAALFGCICIAVDGCNSETRNDVRKVLARGTRTRKGQPFFNSTARRPSVEFTMPPPSPFTTNFHGVFRIISCMRDRSRTCVMMWAISNGLGSRTGGVSSEYRHCIFEIPIWIGLEVQLFGCQALPEVSKEALEGPG